MSTAVEASGTTASVGLLMVHGIGQQRQGDPLRGLTTALLERLPALPADPPLTARLTSATLRGDELAHAWLQIRSGDGLADTEWLLAESLWADVHHAPSTWATLSFLVVQAPALALARTVDALRSAFAQWWNHPVQWWRIPAAAALCVVAQPVVLLILLLAIALTLLRGIIPIEWLKQAVVRVEALVSQVLGDGVLYATDEVSRQAMATKVRADLEFVRQHCSKVVVVAHSQGAAVTVRALNGGPPVDALITLGSGIGTLEWLRRGSRVESAVASLGWLAAVGLSVVVIGAAYVALSPGLSLSDPVETVAGIVGPGAVLLVGGVVANALRATSNRTVLVPEGQGAVAGRWLDLHATADPVSGGALTALLHPEAASRSVRNHNSLLRDHTAYLGNGPEVVDVIAAEALALSGRAAATGIAGATADRTTRLAPLRHQRGRVLSGLRLLVFGSAVATVALGWQAVGSTGDRLLRALPRPVVDLLPEDVLGMSPATVAGAGTLVLLLGLQYAAVVGAWRFHAMAEDEAARTGAPARTVNSLRLAAAGLTPALVVLFLVVHPLAVFDPATYARLGPGLFDAFVMLLVTAVLGVAVWTATVRRLERSRPRTGPRLSVRPYLVAVTAASAVVALLTGPTLHVRPWSSLPWTGVVLAAAIGLCAVVRAGSALPAVQRRLDRPLPTSLLPAASPRPVNSTFLALGLAALIVVQALVLALAEGTPRWVAGIAVCWLGLLCAIQLQLEPDRGRTWRLLPWLAVVLLTASCGQTLYLAVA